MKWLPVLLLLCSPAAAQDHEIAHSGSWTITVPNTACQEVFPDIPKIAERLHVEPGYGTGSFVMAMCDGRKYDFFALLNALLDKMDQANAKP